MSETWTKGVPGGCYEPGGWIESSSLRSRAAEGWGLAPQLYSWAPRPGHKSLGLPRFLASCLLMRSCVGEKAWKKTQSFMGTRPIIFFILFSFSLTRSLILSSASQSINY